MNVYTEPMVYAVKHKDLDVRMASRSGGFFTALTDLFLDANGIVYGCVMDKDFNVVHFRSDNKNDRDLMRGSKYVQSDMLNMFRMVKLDLEQNKMVLFSGTSCQVAGLKSFLKKDFNNLFCVDIVCHGVPSPLVFKKYIKFQEKNNEGKCISFDFRNKKDFGWASHIETLVLKREYSEIRTINSKIFANLFYAHHILRPACYSCPYKDVLHPGDITIADYWGIDKACPGFNDNKGVSLVLINNSIGKKWFEKIVSIEYQSCKLEDSMQPPLEKPFDEPEDRERFWCDLRTNHFRYVVENYAKVKLESKRRMFLIKCARTIKRAPKFARRCISRTKWRIVSLFE